MDKKFKRGAIFRKFLLILILLSLIPVAFSAFLTISTYQNTLTDLKKEGLLPESNLKQLNQNILIQISLILFLLTILVTFASVLISQNITRPLSALVQGIKKVSQGNLNIQFKVKSRDELGELSSVFNQMTANLKEQREKERFFAKELQEKIDELEKFHKLAVGRELKMIELKKEIKTLKTKTGR